MMKVRLITLSAVFTAILVSAFFVLTSVEAHNLHERMEQTEKTLQLHRDAVIENHRIIIQLLRAQTRPS